MWQDRNRKKTRERTANMTLKIVRAFLITILRKKNLEFCDLTIPMIEGSIFFLQTLIIKPQSQIHTNWKIRYNYASKVLAQESSISTSNHTPFSRTKSRVAIPEVRETDDREFYVYHLRAQIFRNPTTRRMDLWFTPLIWQPHAGTPCPSQNTEWTSTLLDLLFNYTWSYSRLWASRRLVSWWSPVRLITTTMHCATLPSVITAHL